MLSEKYFGKNKDKFEKNENENLQPLILHTQKVQKVLVDLKIVSRVNEYIISVKI